MNDKYRLIHVNSHVRILHQDIEFEASGACNYGFFTRLLEDWLYYHDYGYHTCTFVNINTKQIYKSMELTRVYFNKSGTIVADVKDSDITFYEISLVDDNVILIPLECEFKFTADGWYNNYKWIDDMFEYTENRIYWCRKDRFLTGDEFDKFDYEEDMNSDYKELIYLRVQVALKEGKMCILDKTHYSNVI